MTERLWCTACGTVTRDQRCDCNRWPDGHEMKREPHFVNYADAMQNTAHEQAQQIEALLRALEGLIEAVRRDCDIRDKGIIGYTGARLTDAKAAIAALSAHQ